MSPKRLLLVSTMVLAWGGFLVFHGLDALPLWLVWTMGPLCWYLGCAAMLVTGSMTAYDYLTARSAAKAEAKASESTRIVVMEFRKLIPSCRPPIGVTREIPPMGGCVI